MSLIQTLPAGKLDIIGDIHGQFDALQNLLHYLGYAPDGTHPQGRKIILVGDLVDRGHDVPAVLNWFMNAYQKGNALMVLGNHELNLLTNQVKDGSGWFFNSRFEKDSQQYAPWEQYPEHQKTNLINFLKKQPIILQRDDLRIVHAAWLPESIKKIQSKIQDNNLDLDIQELYQEYDENIYYYLKHTDWFDDYLREQAQYAHDLENVSIIPPILNFVAQHDVFLSEKHPLRALTCGVETPAPMPFFASGKWRFSIRHAWWDNYHDDIPVIIGHYWRQWNTNAPQPKHRETIFTIPPHHWHGARKNVFCCDFSVGTRWRDRKKNIAPSDSDYRLGAIRWPEKTLVFDNGEIVQTVFGN